MELIDYNTVGEQDPMKRAGLCDTVTSRNMTTRQWRDNVLIVTVVQSWSNKAQATRQLKGFEIMNCKDM